MKNLRTSTLKFLKTPSDARQLTMVGIVAVGVMASFWSLVPKPYRGQTPQELSENVRQATKQRVEWASAPLTDPETDAAKIEVQWQKVTGQIADENAPLIAARARGAFRSRTWPVDALWGRVNGKGVWIIIAKGENRVARVSGIQLVSLKNGLSGGDDDGGYYPGGGTRGITPTEIAIIDSEKPFNLLYHEDR